ncbi:MAG: inositol monophosphatase family protein [Nannocystaceae bacterium]
MTVLLSFAIEAARDAGTALLARFEGDFEVETKSSAVDLVTTADREAEALIVDRIRANFPDHAILAEEGGAIVGDDAPASGIQWIIDPLDGTTNFAHGIPHFCVSIAMWEGGQPRVGVVHDPCRNETFFAHRGHGAVLETPRGPHRHLAVRGGDRLNDALLATGFAYHRGQGGPDNLAELCRMVPRIRGIRRAGSAALDLAYVAAGRLDGYWEHSLSPWDTAAGALLVAEAGGVMSRIDGGPWTPWERSVVAVGPALRDPLLAALAEAPRP